MPPIDCTSPCPVTGNPHCRWTACLGQHCYLRDDCGKPERRNRGGILGLDVASTTGHCYVFPGQQPIYGSRKIAKVGSDHGAVSHAFRTWLGGLVMEYRPKWIVFEAPYIPMPRVPKFRKAVPGLVSSAAFSPAPPPMNMETIYRLCGLCFEVEGIAAEFGIACRKIETQAWCKGFTGAGRYKGGREAKKEAVMAACKLRGWDIRDSDAADAVGIAVYAESILAPKAAGTRPIGGLFA